jgi:hypothetical protein
MNFITLTDGGGNYGSNKFGLLMIKEKCVPKIAKVKQMF